jgi:hypothetical protein
MRILAFAFLAVTVAFAVACGGSQSSDSTTGGEAAVTSSGPSTNNVVVYFPNQDSPVLPSYVSELDVEVSRAGTNHINAYFVTPREDHSVTICVEANNAGNQYRVLEFTKNSIHLVPGATARMSSSPCEHADGGADAGTDAL